MMNGLRTVTIVSERYISAFGEREKRKEEKVRISQCTQLDSLSKELFIPNSSSSILLLFSVQSKRVHE